MPISLDQKLKSLSSIVTIQNNRTTTNKQNYIRCATKYIHTKNKVPATVRWSRGFGRRLLNRRPTLTLLYKLTRRLQALLACPQKRIHQADLLSSFGI